jgi:hypothetical protein
MKPYLTSFRIRALVLCVGLALATAAIGSCGGGERALQGAFYKFLHFVPDRPEYRDYLTFGDAAAWYTSWDVPRIDSVDQLEALGREPRAYWLYIMPKQTNPPDYMFQYFLLEDLRSFYGFGPFDLDRYLVGGNPPSSITVAGFSFDAKQIADALTGSGYQAEKLQPEGTLYRIRGDNEIDPDSPIKTGQLGHLNRIALLDGEMIIGRATAPVTASLAAYNNQIPSLADNPEYVALLQALDDPVLAGTGELMGAIVMSGGDTLEGYIARGLEYRATPEQVQAKLAELRQGPQLPAYSLVAFVTRHTKGATYLILAVVFPEGTDAQAAADLLVDRLRNYVSPFYGGLLADVWAEHGTTVEKGVAVKANGLPVAVILVRADDPPPAPPDQATVGAAVSSWWDLVMRRDLGFLWR